MIGLVFFGGVLFGCILVLVILRIKSVGSLRVDYADPDSGPYLFLELSRQGMGVIERKKYILLKVNLKNDLSQK